MLAKAMAGVFQGVAENDYPDAISRVSSMIQTTAKIASSIDETIRYEYHELIFTADANTEGRLRKLIRVLQAYFNELMWDSPRTALRRLRTAMFILGDLEGIRDSIVVEVDGIDLKDENDEDI
ncbi:had-superfamily subfamily variant 1 [Colletotrichum musicola]|uniref:Had-superfamily subfamily variant 1 n=1 Tax=Colletotrichum musicola TaxID=2175873 RepID=A0A8H6KCB4_9PEZI|nr:had-superfamily subfamily variant 1 [Colletotrichum musicola]